MRHSIHDICEMASAIGGTQIAARQWLEAGFSPGDAAAYARAGCFDVDRTAKLKEAHIAPHLLATSGLAWDYCSGSVTLMELQRLVIVPETRSAALLLN